jgi:hypothetical protein
VRRDAADVRDGFGFDPQQDKPGAVSCSGRERHARESQEARGIGRDREALDASALDQIEIGLAMFGAVALMAVVEMRRLSSPSKQLLCQGSGRHFPQSVARLPVLTAARTTIKPVGLVESVPEHWSRSRIRWPGDPHRN